ncbi:hypothetical protein [Neobacillus sp. LXY-4]|uniref:hypothetical protein n=1 Tax=Neobacillus sp. LXY-4 TaxID=3379826 RepID=UPI003EE04D0D
MANDVTLNNLSIKKNVRVSELDGLIKLTQAGMITAIPFLFFKPMSLVLLTVYLLIITFILRMNRRTIAMSAFSYCIVFLFPYLFGLLINSLLYFLSGNDVFALQQSPYEIFLRLFRLFIIWYVSILYFHTTDTKTVIGMFDKLLSPLKLIGVPVADYLKVIMCIVLELTEMGSEVKKSLAESMRSVMGESRRKFRVNINGVSQIIVSLIVNSFDKLDRIESFIEKAEPDDLYHYRFKLSVSDGVSIFSFFLLIYLVLMVEQGHWL